MVVCDGDGVDEGEAPSFVGTVGFGAATPTFVGGESLPPPGGSEGFFDPHPVVSPIRNTPTTASGVKRFMVNLGIVS